MGKVFHDIRKRLTSIYDEAEAQAITFLLLESVCGLSKTDILMDKDEKFLVREKNFSSWKNNFLGREEVFPREKLEILNGMTTRLVKGEPIQYVIGETSFCGLTIKVRKGVLIPRPETEELIESVSNLKPNNILDIGTGSGCIALALKNKYPEAHVTAFDISDEALEIAKDNAYNLDLDVEFVKTDILKNPTSDKKFDLIVSNPPYICNNEKAEMEKNVLENEPSLALFVPDDDPLLFYRTITSYATKYLTQGGTLAFEINRKYGKDIVKLLMESGFKDVELKKDSFNNDRIVLGCL